MKDRNSREFYKFAGSIKKFVGDSDPRAQERGIEATLAFVENAAVAGTVAGDVCLVIVAKCLNKSTKSKDLGIKVLMKYIEGGQQKAVERAVRSGLTMKNPKIVTACLAVQEVLRTSGTKMVSIEPMVTSLNDKDHTLPSDDEIELCRASTPASTPKGENEMSATYNDDGFDECSVLSMSPEGVAPATDDDDYNL